MGIHARTLKTGPALAVFLAFALIGLAGAALAGETGVSGDGAATAPGVYKSDMKAEGETEGETEGENEGETEPPPPSLDTVTLLTPAGNVVAPRSMSPVSIFFAASVTLTATAPAGTVPDVAFVIDGKAHTATLREGTWQVITDLPMGTSHKVQVRARVTVAGQSAPEEKLSGPLSFAVRFADDLDANGYPDDPFKALAGAGDEWHGIHETEACARLVLVTALKASSVPVTVYMANPGNLAQLWTVTVPAGLVLSNERAMLMLATACDETTLYAPEDAPGVDQRPGTVVPGAGFFESHLIVSADSGKTFTEVGAERLDGQPLEMRWRAIRPSTGNTTALYGRDSFVEGDGTTGLTVIAGDEPWVRDGILLTEAPEKAGTMAARVSRCCMMAPFQTPQPPRLEITPGGDSGFFGFGIVVATQAATQDFTLTNTGSEPLSGTVTLDDPSDVFMLKQPPDYTIEAGSSAVISLQFIPPFEGDYLATLTFTGGETGPQMLTITGTGTAKPPKAVVLFGCNGGGPVSGDPSTDLAAVLVAMAALAFGARRIRA